MIPLFFAITNLCLRNNRLHFFSFTCYIDTCLSLAFLENAKKDLSDNSQSNNFGARRPALLRSLFIAGLLCKHFDFDKHMDQNKKVTFRVLSYF